MVMKVSGYAAQSAKEGLAPWRFERRDPRPDDVVIDILYCGVCHSDLHNARNDWGGRDLSDGAGPRDHRPRRERRRQGHALQGGRRRGRRLHGRFLPALQAVPAAGWSSIATRARPTPTTRIDRHDDMPTYGGYSEKNRRHREIRPEGSGRARPRRAPRRCCAPASPPGRRCATGMSGKGSKVAVVGLGGLGHMGLKLAKALGAACHLVHALPGQGSRRPPAGRGHGGALDRRGADGGGQRPVRPDHRHRAVRSTTSTPTCRRWRSTGRWCWSAISARSIRCSTPCR